MTSLNVSDQICTWLEGNLKSFNVVETPVGTGWMTSVGGAQQRMGLGWWIKELVGVEDCEQQLLWRLSDVLFFQTFSFSWEVAVIYDPELRRSHITSSKCATTHTRFDFIMDTKQPKIFK